MKRIVMLLVLLLVITGVASAAEQQWIDRNNKTHFRICSMRW